MAWTCTQTYGGHERRAVGNLERQGYEAFCPFYARPAPPGNQRRRGAAELPLFPCYVFVRLNDGQLWSAINYTFGVVRLLTNRDPENPKPLWVADHYIETISHLQTEAGDNRLPVNTVVRIKERKSPLYDRVGTVVEMDRHQRIKVLMSLFNRDVVVLFETPIGLEVVALPDDVVLTG